MTIKYSQDSRKLLNSTVVCMITIFSPISKPLEIVSSAQSTFSIIVSFMFHRFFLNLCQGPSICLSFLLEWQNSLNDKIFFFLLVNTRYSILAWIE